MRILLIFSLPSLSRIRPQSTREKIEMCKICTNVTPNEPQVTLGHKEDKSFTFDYVFDQDSEQRQIYSKCVLDLVDACFDGYNATVLAYGQTGSGKTYTMGTSFDPNLLPDEEGIIPRAIEYLFEKIDNIKRDALVSGDSPTFTVLVQFMELYNEEVIDLFSSLPQISFSTAMVAATQDGQFQTTETFVYNKTVKSKIEIHEDQNGGINVQGCSVHEVRSTSEVELLY